MDNAILFRDKYEFLKCPFILCSRIKTLLSQNTLFLYVKKKQYLILEGTRGYCDSRDSLILDGARLQVSQDT